MLARPAAAGHDRNRLSPGGPCKQRDGGQRVLAGLRLRPVSVRFDHVISLGSDCDPALQLERLGWKDTHSVFDWLVTPWDAMMAVLRDGADRLATQLTPAINGLGLACAEYGLVYWHEFPRDAAHKAVFSEEQAARTRGKLRHKMSQMRAACEGRGNVLFIRAGVVTNAPGDRFAAGETFDHAELDRCAALIEALHPRLRFSLLLVHYPGRDALGAGPVRDPRVLTAPLPLSGDVAAGTLTKSANADWDAVLSQIPYRRAFAPAAGLASAAG